MSLSVCLAACGDGEGEIRTGVGAGVLVPRPISDRPGSRRLLVLAEPGQVPGVARQPTVRGRAIGALVAFGSRVYLGYGDYTANTGPIAAVFYSVRDGTFGVGPLLGSEELLEFEVHSGFLFVANLDPHGHQAVGSVFRHASDDERWREMSHIAGAVHTFALAEFEESLMVATGSVTGDIARVARSSDAGVTWQDSHTTHSPADGFTRYTHMAATGELLFVSGRVHSEPEQAFAYTLVDADWHGVADVPSEGFLVPIALRNELLVARFHGDVGKGGKHLDNYGLEQGRLVSAEAFPPDQNLVNWSLEVTASGSERLWVLSERANGRQVLGLASNFADWELILNLPELQNGDRFSALCYLDDAVYLSTLAGGLFVVDEIFELVPSD